MDYDWSAPTPPVSFGELAPAELRRQIASHEAGHAVVGVVLGFALDHITLGLGEEHIVGGIVAGGCVFEAPGGDHNGLAKLRPNDFAVVSLAGVSAERLLTERFLDGGFEGDIRLLRIGFGWVDALDPSQDTQLCSLLTAAQDQVVRWRPTIAQVADMLIRSDHLDGRVVHELVDAMA